MSASAQLSAAAPASTRRRSPGSRRWRPLAAALLPLLTLNPCIAQPVPERNVLQERQQRFHAVWSAGGMVAAQEPQAGAAGVAMLRQGGNAVDAAVASAFALAVTLPQAGSLGGGGFLLLWLPGPSTARQRGCLAGGGGLDPELRLGRGTAVGIDYRERAPAAARSDLFLSRDGSVDRQRASRSLASSGVPGAVAGLVLAQRCYGRLPLRQVIAPAIALAERGVPVSRELADSLQAAVPLLGADPSSRRVFLRPDRQGRWQPPPPGGWLRQGELAGTLRLIAARGHNGFYDGPVARSLLALMQRGDGLIRPEDLRRYGAVLVRPLQIRFRDHPVLSLPPPAGGLSLLQLLALLDPLDLPAAGGAAALHLLAEAMNLVYRDRNTLLGDPEQAEVPVDSLLSPDHLDGLRRRIDRRHHTPAARLEQAPTDRREGANTTHLSTVDRNGGLAALTTSLNFAYGNGITIPGTGVLLNNTMDDFTARVGAANAFGLRQGERNRIAPRARPLSSMAPTLVFRPDGRPWLALGSPGGSRITTSLLQVLLNRLVHGLNLATAIAEPRIHSQLWPDSLGVEQGLSPDTLQTLQAMGHRLEPAQAMGAVNAVEHLPGADAWTRGSLGVADPRRAEAPAVGE
ncbi:MAG: gamma-glutamyltransferase [Synechococcaceae cyanobacterium]|nr:gamma-glutamyltransferase [Synechococcaceae cyanobacterium]